MKRYVITGFVSTFVLSGCISVDSPNVLTTESPGVALQAKVEAVPADAGEIGRAMEIAEKPWKQKEEEENAKGGAGKQGTTQAGENNKDNTMEMNDTKKSFDRERAQALATKYTGAVMRTNKGDITLEFFGNDAPLSVGNFAMLAEDGFYDNVIFHRIIKGFMIQGGDPTGTGMGGPKYQFEDEINAHKIVRGALAMANAGPGTNGSQFFVVTTESAPWLDGKHTVFGTVTDGMDTVDAIEAAKTGAADKPVEDIVIQSIELIEQ